MCLVYYTSCGYYHFGFGTLALQNKIYFARWLKIRVPRNPKYFLCLFVLTFSTNIWQIGVIILLIILSQIFLKIVSKTFYFTSYLKFFLQNNVIILFLGFNLVSTIFFLMNFTWKKKYTADEHVLFMRCRFSGADESIDDRLRT